MITARAKALLQEMQFSENDLEGITNFKEDPDGGSNSESDVIELDDSEDGESVGDANIELVEDGLGRLALATQKGVPMPKVPAEFDVKFNLHQQKTFTLGRIWPCLSRVQVVTSNNKE